MTSTAGGRNHRNLNRGVLGEVLLLQHWVVSRNDNQQNVYLFNLPLTIIKTKKKKRNIAMSDNEAGARFSPQPNRSKTYCVVPKCCSKAKREITVRFHCFPKTSANDYVSIANRQGVLEMMTRREAWEQRLMLESHKVSKSSRVCSLHFRRNDYILPGL